MVLAAHPSYQKSKIKGLFSNSQNQNSLLVKRQNDNTSHSLGQRLPSCQENGIPVYRAAREYGAPQSMLKDRVHLDSQLTLIKSLVFYSIWLKYELLDNVHFYYIFGRNIAMLHILYHRHVLPCCATVDLMSFQSACA